MRKNTKLFGLLISLVTIFLFVNSTKAATTYTTKVVNSFDKDINVTLRGDGVVNQSGWAKSNTGQYSIYYKHSANYYALCTTFAKENADASYKCTKDTSGWSADDAVASGVAAIILQGSGGKNATMGLVEYFNTELAINKYLSKIKNYGKSSNKVGYTGSNLSKIKALKNIGTKSENAYNDFKSKTKTPMNIKLTALKCSGNTCTTKVSYSGVKEKSTKYDSISLPDTPNIKVTGGTYTYNKNTKTITITRSSNTTAVTVKVSATVTRKYYVAQNYNCGSNNQSITPNKVVEKTQTRKLATSKSNNGSGSGGSEIVDDCDFMLYKVNTKGEPLEGSSFYLFENVTSKQTYKDFSDSEAELEAGEEETYNGACIPLHDGAVTSIPYLEKDAPKGYKKLTQAETIQLTDALKEAGEYNIENVPDTSLLVYKKDGDSNKKVAGAKLVLYKGDKIVKWAATGETDSEGNKIVKPTEYIDVSDDNLTAEQITQLENSASWTTTATGGMKFIELDYDNYTVEELSAPSNYIINDEVKPITLSNEDGKRAQTLEVIDYASSVTISKQDITTKKEVPGAQLKIVDGQGNVYAEWTSSDKPHVINTLADGTYYLSETTAPKGYELNTEKIIFEVENGKSKSEVIMENRPNRVSVADTLLSKKVITYVLGSMLIIAGAGVLFYEIKKKKHS